MNHPRSASPSLLCVRALSFHYPGGAAALSGVDFTLDVGEKVALLGPNGAGKSTLLLHLNGVQECQAGDIVVGGERLDKRSLAAVRGIVGLVFQNPDDQLFCASVEEDVAFGPRCQGLRDSDLDRAVSDALAAVGMTDLAARFPQHLSGGEKKRAALATVLSMQPRLLALDEPTAGLDARARRAVITILGSLPQAMLVATHDLEFAKELCDRALILDGGAIVYDGLLEEALLDRALLERHGLLA